VVGVVTGVAVGTLSGVLGLVLELFKERRSGLLESRNAIYSEYLAALAQWANLLSEAAEATDPSQREGLQRQERSHELEHLIPAQARLRLIASRDVVEAARAATNVLRSQVGREGSDRWPDYTAAYREMLQTFRDDLKSGNRERHG
jgi:uncharacterized membrane protein YccC